MVRTIEQWREHKMTREERARLPIDRMTVMVQR